MKWWNRDAPAGSVLPSRRHGRHGRAGRSMTVRPPLPPIATRYERFDLGVGSAAEYLRGSWPELREVSFEIAGMPTQLSTESVPRWWVSREDKRIVVFRVLVERMGLGEVTITPPPGLDRRRIEAESVTFRAAADYLQRDVWELGPGQEW